MALIDAASPETAQVNADIDRLFGTKRMQALTTLLLELEQALGRGEPGD